MCFGKLPSSPTECPWCHSVQKWYACCQRLEKMICFETSWGLGMSGRRWIRPCSCEVVPCPSPPSSTVSVTHGTLQVALASSTPFPKRLRDQKSLLGRRPRMGQGFKKPDHEISTLSFNTTFILEFYIAATQELVARCLFFFIFSAFLVFSLSSFNSLLMECSIKWL